VANLKLEDGSIIYDHHHQMAGKFLDSFKSRMAGLWALIWALIYEGWLNMLMG
jgi:hypothetical protein